MWFVKQSGSIHVVWFVNKQSGSIPGVSNEIAAFMFKNREILEEKEARYMKSVELVHHPVIQCVVLSGGNVARRDDGGMVSRHVSVRLSGISGILIYKFAPH